MLDNGNDLNGVYLGIVSLVCLLTYLAVSREKNAVQSSSRALAGTIRCSTHSIARYYKAAAGIFGRTKTDCY